MITDAWMQFDWTLALPMTLLLVYFLFILQRYCWRIYKRFRLPSDAAVTGAFNIGGQLDDAPQQARDFTPRGPLPPSFGRQLDLQAVQPCRNS